MHIYTIASRTGLLIIVILWIAICSLPMVALLNRGPRPAVLIVGILMLGGAWVAGQGIYQIRVSNDGMIHLVRLLGVTHVPIGEVSVLEGFRTRQYDKTVWMMRIRYGRKAVTVPFFNRAPGFLSVVRRLDPDVNIRGEWPTLDPWGDTKEASDTRRRR